MDKVLVKFFTNDGNVVLLPVSTEDPVPPIGLKPAETYKDALKRNYKNVRRNRLLGSVLLK